MNTIKTSVLSVKIEKYIGKGSHGEVYKTLLGNAIKVEKLKLNSYNNYLNYFESIKNNLNDGFLLKSLCHIYKIEYIQNLKLIYIDGKCDKYFNVMVIWMEYCETSLSSVLSKLKYNKYEDVYHHYYSISKQLLLAVKECSNKKMILGDLSINNIMINGFPTNTQIKIIDYLYENGEIASTHSAPEYMIFYKSLHDNFDSKCINNYNYTFDYIAVAFIISYIYLRKNIYEEYLAKYFKIYPNKNVINNVILLNSLFLFVVNKLKSNNTIEDIYKTTNHQIYFNYLFENDPLYMLHIKNNNNKILNEEEYAIVNYCISIIKKLNMISFENFITHNIISSKLNISAFIQFLYKLLSYDYRYRELDFDLFDQIFSNTINI